MALLMGRPRAQSLRPSSGLLRSSQRPHITPTSTPIRAQRRLLCASAPPPAPQPASSPLLPTNTPSHSPSPFTEEPTPKEALERFSNKAKLVTGFWDLRENRLAYLEFLKKQLGMNSLEDFYNVTASIINETGGRQFLLKYKGSLSEAVADLYPDHKWQPWKFQQAPKNWWASLGLRFAAKSPEAVQMVKQYIEELAAQHEIVKLKDWEKYVHNPKRLLGTTAMTHLAFIGSLPLVLPRIYPKHEWNFSEEDATESKIFRQGSKVDFSNKNTRKRYMEHVLRHMGGEPSLEKLYELDSRKMIETGGSAFLQQMDNSPANTVMSVYPDHNWKRWKFSVSPKGWWAELADKFLSRDPAAESTVREFVADLAIQHGVDRLEDWYRVSNEQLGSTVLSHLSHLGKLGNVLWRLHPHHQWDFSKFERADKKSAQRVVKNTLEEGFPTEFIEEEQTCENLGFKFIPTGAQFRFDVAIKDLKLVVEYQGGHHFFDTYVVGGVKLYKTRDETKRALCERNGFTLVELPYWWDNKVDSLMNTIRVVRPDLVPEPFGDGKPIPAEPSKRYAFERPRAELASLFMGYSRMKPDPKQFKFENWDMVEKVDGVRVMWNGDYLYTTQGIVIHPPAEWKKSLPTGYADGMLISSKGDFYELVSVLNARYQRVNKRNSESFPAADTSLHDATSNPMYMTLPEPAKDR